MPLFIEQERSTLLRHERFGTRIHPFTAGLVPTWFHSPEEYSYLRGTVQYLRNRFRLLLHCARTQITADMLPRALRCSSWYQLALGALVGYERLLRGKYPCLGNANHQIRVVHRNSNSAQINKSHHVYRVLVAFTKTAASSTIPAQCRTPQKTNISTLKLSKGIPAVMPRSHMHESDVVV